jgi:hypothetical protein
MAGVLQAGTSLVGIVCSSGGQKFIELFKEFLANIHKHRRFPMITDDFQQTPENALAMWGMGFWGGCYEGAYSCGVGKIV